LVKSAVDTPHIMEVPPGEPPLTPEERARKLVGRVLSDRYRLYDLIATGGMGAVYRADHLFLKKRVAVKLLHPEMENMPDLVARFEREAVAGAHVRHPNVAAATDFGKLDDGSYFLVLEHVRGKTLSEVIRKGKLAPARAAAIARQIAAALDAVHAMGVVHRDIKPRNIMLVDGGDVVKLVDFGLALVRMDRISRPSVRPPQPSHPNPARLTFSGEVFGTAAYLAPEAAYGMDRVDGRADLYALGIVLYEMLAGKRPFESDDTTDILLMHRSKRPPPIGRDDVPPALEAVAMRLLAKEAADRYQTGAEVIRALDAVYPPADQRPSRRPTPPPPPPRGKAVLLAATGLAVLLALEGYRLLHARAPDAPPPVAASPSPLAPATASTEDAAYREPTRLHANAIPPEAIHAVSPGHPEPPAGADTARLLFLRAARARDRRGAARALLSLADKDAAAFRDPEVALAARDVAASLDPDTVADEVFDALSSRLGGPGVDILYGVVEVRGGSRAAARAAELLRRGDVISAASPELRIAFALREAPCDQKPALFSRAAEEGDARALAVLETLGRSCFVHNQQLEEAINALRAKTRARP
jgi:serine/threonine-protein kinase